MGDLDDTKTEVNEKHLEFIESSIERMARNSFQAKAWCITIIAALLAFCLTRESGSDAYWKSLAASCVVIVMFCAIDSYYLYLERGFRELYKGAAHLSGEIIVKDYSMGIPASARGAKKYIAVFKSPSIWLFYLVLLALHIVLFFI